VVLLSPTAFIAFLGGIAPALVWLGFWLYEDRCEPEPKWYIFFSFIAGMAVVAPVLFIERGVIPYIEPAFLAGASASPLLLLLWALTEEVFKFGAAYFVALRSYVFDEPVDAVIYLVTAALGFSSLENALFLFGAINHGGVLHGIITSDLRFIGATLLHTLSSATIGIALAFSFYKSRAVRRLFALCGVVLAVTLHTLFNFFILGRGGDATFFIFLCIWFGIIAVLSFVERIKQPARDYC
jgi:RsiW-degrading membrane proteinase PrsW (M82 family)